MEKICSKCGIKKDAGEFHKEKKHSTGLRSDCKKCNNKRSQKYLKENKDKVLAYRRKYYHKNKERLLPKLKEYRDDNKEHISNRKKKRYKERYNNDDLYRLSFIVRDYCRRVTDAVKQDKELRSLEYLGCSLEEFKSHIESLWLEGMSWDNHGVDGWHIDHKVPLDYFVKNSDDPWEANHYTNLQPLWAADNLSKGASI